MLQSNFVIVSARRLFTLQLNSILWFSYMKHHFDCIIYDKQGQTCQFSLILHVWLLQANKPVSQWMDTFWNERIQQIALSSYSLLPLYFAVYIYRFIVYGYFWIKVALEWIYKLHIQRYNGNKIKKYIANCLWHKL